MSKPKKMAQLVAEYGTGIDEIRHDLRTEHSQLVRGKSLVLRKAAGKRSDVAPAYHSAVDELLKTLSGEAYGKVIWLLVFFLNLNHPVPALWLTGATGVGKTLLVRGLAKLWARGKYIPGERATHHFNAALLQTPLICFDEHPPRDSRGQPDLDRLKLLVTDDSHEVERKGVDIQVMDGHVRVCLTSNNLEMLKPDRDLTEEDIDAVVERVVHVDCCGADARRAKAVLSRHDYASWMRMIPEHVVFLQRYQNHENAPEPSRLRTPSHAPMVAQTLRTESGRTGDLILLLTRFMKRHRESEGKTSLDGLIVRRGQLFAMRSCFELDNWNVLMPALRLPGTRQLNASWKRLVSGAPVSIRHRTKGARKYRVVRLEMLRTWSVANDEMGDEELTEALSFTTDGVAP